MKEMDEVDMRIGIVGLGVVGASVVKLLQEHSRMLEVKAGQPIELISVSASSRSKDRGVDISSFKWEDDPLAIASSDEIDCLVEVVGGSDGIAREVVEVAIANGKHVITANKALLARHGHTLALRAEAQGKALRFESAVAGGIPVIHAINSGLSANKFSRVSGILNGTCNYILTRMEQDKAEYTDALHMAQRLGYAEGDPRDDVEGYDAAYKLIILSSLVFNIPISFSDVKIKGISSLGKYDIQGANSLGYKIRLIADAQSTDSGIVRVVEPLCVRSDAFMARVSGVTNAVEMQGSHAGSITMMGAGAGGDATASSVVSDIVSVARYGASEPIFGVHPSLLQAQDMRSNVSSCEGGVFTCMVVSGNPSDLAEGISGIFSAHGGSIEKYNQIAVEEGDLICCSVKNICCEVAEKCAIDIKGYFHQYMQGDVRVLGILNS